MKRMLLLLENTHIQKIRISDSDHLWKTVISFSSLNLPIAHFAKDKFAGDPNCGCFGVFDGHGGK